MHFLFFFFVRFFLCTISPHPPIHRDGVSLSFLSLSFPFTALHAVVEDCGQVGLLFVFRRQDRGFRSGRAGSGQMNRRFLFFSFSGFWIVLDGAGQDGIGEVEEG